MNLDALVAPYTRTVNTPTIATLRVSTGATVNADYSRTPGFADFPGVTIDVQAASGADLKHMDALNIQGIPKVVYFVGLIEGLDRPAGKGGDLLVFGGQTWLCTQISENWNEQGWVRVVVTLQNGS